MATETTSEIGHRSSALLDHLARLMRVSGEAALAPLGLRPRHMVALTVLREGGETTQQALAATLQIDRTNLVGLLNELEDRDLVTRTRSTEDRRRHIVVLTPGGLAKLAEAEAAIGETENEVLGALDGDQREQLYELLKLATDGQAANCSEAVAHDCVE